MGAAIGMSIKCWGMVWQDLKEDKPVSSRALNPLFEKLKSSYSIFGYNVEGRRNADITGVNCELYKYKTNVRDRVRHNSLA
jgi:hypothetical protein